MNQFIFQVNWIYIIIHYKYIWILNKIVLLFCKEDKPLREAGLFKSGFKLSPSWPEELHPKTSSFPFPAGKKNFSTNEQNPKNCYTIIRVACEYLWWQHCALCHSTLLLDNHSSTRTYWADCLQSCSSQRWRWLQFLLTFTWKHKRVTKLWHLTELTRAKSQHSLLSDVRNSNRLTSQVYGGRQRALRAVRGPTHARHSPGMSESVCPVIFTCVTSVCGRKYPRVRQFPAAC